MKKIAVVTIALIMIASISFSTLAAPEVITREQVAPNHMLNVKAYPLINYELGRYLSYNNTFNMQYNGFQNPSYNVNDFSMQYEGYNYVFSRWFSAFNWSTGQQPPDNSEGYFDDYVYYEFHQYDFRASYTANVDNMGNKKYMLATIGAIISLDTITEEAEQSLTSSLKMYLARPNGNVMLSIFEGTTLTTDFENSYGHKYRAYLGYFVVPTDDFDRIVIEDEYDVYFDVSIGSRESFFITDLRFTDFHFSYLDDPYSELQNIFNSVKDMETNVDVIDSNVSALLLEIQTMRLDVEAWIEGNRFEEFANDLNNDIQSDKDELADKIDEAMSSIQNGNHDIWNDPNSGIMAFISTLWANPFIGMCSTMLTAFYGLYILIFRG